MKITKEPHTCSNGIQVMYFIIHGREWIRKIDMYGYTQYTIFDGATKWMSEDEYLLYNR